VSDDPMDTLQAHMTGDVDWIRLKFVPGRPAVAHRCDRCGKGEWRQDGEWAVCVTCERKGVEVRRWQPSP
jgi:uncharacterized Zn finger protein (UPF0148 family)